MISSKFTETKGYYGYAYYSGEDITDQMIEQCFELDRSFFKEEFLYNVDRVRRWLKNHREMCSVLYSEENNEVIAYCFYLFISDEALQLYKQNKLSYFTMGESLFVSPKRGDRLNLFCLSDACKPGWDFVQTHRIMNEYNVLNLCKMARDLDVLVKNVCIDSVCEYEETLVKQFHISNNTKTNHNTKFYWGKFDPTQTWTYCVYSSTLIELYKS